MTIHVEHHGDIVEPDPYPNTKLKQMINGVPIADEDIMVVTGKYPTPYFQWPRWAAGTAAFLSVLYLWGE